MTTLSYSPLTKFYNGFPSYTEATRPLLRCQHCGEVGPQDRAECLRCDKVWHEAWEVDIKDLRTIMFADPEEETGPQEEGGPGGYPPPESLVAATRRIAAHVWLEVAR